MSHIVFLFSFSTISGALPPIPTHTFLEVYPVVEIINIAIAYGFSEDNNFDKADINTNVDANWNFFYHHSKTKTLLKYTSLICDN